MVIRGVVPGLVLRLELRLGLILRLHLRLELGLHLSVIGVVPAPPTLRLALPLTGKARTSPGSSTLVVSQRGLVLGLILIILRLNHLLLLRTAGFIGAPVAGVIVDIHKDSRMRTSLSFMGPLPRWLAGDFPAPIAVPATILNLHPFALVVRATATGGSGSLDARFLDHGAEVDVAPFGVAGRGPSLERGTASWSMGPD